MALIISDIVETDDWKLAIKLRQEDPVQFHTLVRMHLSFVLDLTTDDCDCQTEKNKFRALKWGLVPFSKRFKGSVKGVMEGAPLTQEGICQVYQLIEFLTKEENIIQEGIFRRTGKLTRQQELKTLLNQGTTLKFEEGQFSVHDCASVLKCFLAELPEPLLTEAYFPAYCQISELCSSQKSNDGRLERALQLLLLLLPAENWIMMKDVLQLLHLVASHEQSNKMSAENLATLFTPHLLCPRKLSPEALHASSQMLSRVVAFMIAAGLDLFKVPPTLATDIRAYWERRKVSPDAQLNESTAATTVFSFVDRERTAQENIANPTEAALAQLYAHIQSLPESSKKRRLIKQFNKENGHGTPRHSNRTRSFGDSIKKHIFNKSKPTKSLIENGQLKHKRSCSEELLTNPDCKSKKPFASKLIFGKCTDDAKVESPDNMPTTLNRISRSFPEEQKSVTDNYLAENRSRKSSGSKPSSDVEEPKHTHFISPCPQSPLPQILEGFSHTDKLPHPARTCTEDVASFFTPPNPGIVKHRHFPVSKVPHFSPLTPANRISCLLTSTPACNNCLHSPTPMLTSTDDMSPITRSTQRMPKAMQEAMITPRSRKPVVALSGSNLCHLANLTWGMKDVSWLDEKQSVENKDIESAEEKDGSDSLTSTFRDYLFSRSVLTASPVDLSFSSRTGDFDPSSCSEEKLLESPLNESLLYCLDGNVPNSSQDSSGISHDSFIQQKSTDITEYNSCLSKGSELSVSSSGLGTENSKEYVFETSL